ncbi:MAG: AAA family ATPase [Spirochaetes bacterium]|jgi:exonuclease SbcC|nr:AAA family ATPase [Spirochaetota bacterium]
MKILKLELANLNSLYGKWEIDFQAPEYISDGLFAITGPTGGGKSTILDALSLALYGRTPRLGIISKSTNEVMSRGSFECSASVIFETQKGCYIATWRQHRAHKNPEGTLAESTHEVSNFRSGQVIESKKSSVGKKIEEITGLDYGRFTRSMLLAQGDFAAFLKTDAGERSTILEQITGTGVYSEISKMVFEISKDKKIRLTEIENLLKEMHVMSEEDELIVKKQIKDLKSEAEQYTKKAEAVSRSITWKETIGDLKTRISDADVKKKIALEKQQNFQKDSVRLERSRSAANYEADYKELCGVREQLKIKEQNLITKKTAEPALLKKIDVSEKSVNKLNLDLKKLKEAQQKLLKITALVRVKDSQLKDLSQDLANRSSDITNRTSELQKQNIRLDSLNKERSNLLSAIENTNKRLNENSADEQLAANYSLLCKNIDELVELNGQIEEYSFNKKEIEIELKKLKPELGADRVRHISATTNSDSFRKRLSEIDRELEQKLKDKSVNDYRHELDSLREQSYKRSAIADYEKDRSKLVPGDPCPLCGSTEHPFVNVHIPPASEFESQIKAIEVILDMVDKLVKEQVDVQKNMSSSEKDLSKIEGVIDLKSQSILMQEKELNKAESDLNKHVLKYEELQKDLLNRLKVWGIEKFSTNSTDSIKQHLKKRLENYQHDRESLDQSEKELQKMELQIAELNATIQTFDSNLQYMNKQFEDLKKAGNELKDEREKLFGDKNCDNEESEAAETIRICEVDLDQQKRTLENLKLQLNTIHTAIAALEADIESIVVKRDKLETGFVKALQDGGFASEEDFVSCRMSVTEREELEKRGEQIKTSLLEIGALIKDLSEKLKDEEDKKLSSSSLEKLITEKEDIDHKLREVHEKSGSLQQQLNDNEASGNKRANKEKEYKAQQAVYERWSRLSHLIGSKDGKKYRTFAQGLTFQIMVHNANIQLGKMSERYLLTQCGENQLELNVVDNHQGGIERTTKNLSGGESFIVSLALALGLSGMAGRNVRIDSLFLDEGFGTLDEETLEVALDTLSSLHNEGKLIGVISHVEALKNRIAARIEVVPGTGGRSTLLGPGCRSSD